MPTITSNFTDFHLQPWSRVQEALGDLLAAENQLCALNNPAVTALYKYVMPIATIAQQEAGNDLMLTSQQELIRYLDPGAVWNFIIDPNYKANRDVLATHLSMISAAVTDMIPLKPYTLDELKRIFNGDQNIYDDLIFLATLHSILAGADAAADAAGLLATSLPPIKEEAAPTEAAVFWWDDVFIQAAMLHAAWSQFPNLPGASQQFLLKNYYYAAIVAGFPVRALIGELLDSDNGAVGPSTKRAGVTRALEANREVVALSTTDSAVELLSELIKKFTSAVLSAPIATLAQEKFIRDIYHNDPGSEQYSAWLRDAASLALHIKKGDIF